MLTATKIPSLQNTLLLAQKLVDTASHDASVKYERFGYEIRQGLLAINREIEEYSISGLLKELRAAPSSSATPEKEIWSVDEAATYYGVTKKGFQNLIGKLKKESPAPSWLLLPTDQVRKTRIHAKKFKEWYAHSPKAKGRPKKQI